MPTATGRLVLGPDTATLSVRTGRTGAAAKAGHDLVIEVTAWEGTLTLGQTPSVTVTADPRSLHVRRGHGGMQPLGDDDKATIRRTIGKEVLRGEPIAFRSTSVTPGEPGHMHVEGELELGGRRGPIAFDLVFADGRLTGGATVTQSAWGIKPYATLFGALKVADDVEVVLEAGHPLR
ncbi:YceI family protein [Baekduia soli]|uniref:YceI family protein n=1 Tax=Baekduia soli TaxID=496014 RepID=A0A5B8U4A8_9ACTN|nr:YceI family protein [Baekduia soli]QEC47936.1 YceI family protein [Baekduia soli]